MQEQINWQEERDSARQFKTTLFLGVVAFGVTLAIILGSKMSQTAASVLTGVVAGVAASVPTSFILLLLLQSRQKRSANDRSIVRTMRYPPTRQVSPTYPQPAGGGMVVPQPPVIVVTSPGHYDPHGQNQGGPVYPGQMAVLTPGPREFQVVGEPGYYVDEGY
jgi:hypothetical protein